MKQTEFDELNGFYAGFMSGSANQGLAMFIFSKGTIAGADFAGTVFDGKISHRKENGDIECSMKVSLPANGTTIQGIDTGQDGLSYETQFLIPWDFEHRSFFNVPTPIGSVNVRLQKLRGLGG